MATKRHRIAIVGGGPAGLCLAILLHKNSVVCTVYELRSQPPPEDLNQPSGSLDLHDDTGLAAIRACDLWDNFLPLTTDCSSAFKVMDREAKITFAHDGKSAYRPEITRNALTSLFLSALPPDSIQWNHKLLSSTKNSDESITLDFGPNGVVECDLVIGADGAWSKVRPLVTDVKPHYGEIRYTTLHILNATSDYPELSRVAGSGTLFALGDRSGLFCQRGVQDCIRLYIAVHNPNSTECSEDITGITRTVLEKELIGASGPFGSWAGVLKDLVTAAYKGETRLTESSTLPPLRPMYMLPIGHTWEAKLGVALIGDAAHLMMPWAGEGVNQALRDSLDLANVIITAYGSRESSHFQSELLDRVTAFDKKMYVRTRSAAQMTWSNSETIFSEGAAAKMADMMRYYLSQQEKDEYRHCTRSGTVLDMEYKIRFPTSDLFYYQLR